MKMNTMLAAGLLISLSAGVGARYLTGADAPLASLRHEAVVPVAAGTWMHPAVTVVMKVPAADGAADHTSATGRAMAAAVEEERPWVHPEIEVIVRVPARETESLAQSTPEQLLPSSEEAEIAAAEEAIWMHPGITVVMDVPGKSAGTFAFAQHRRSMNSRWAR